MEIIARTNKATIYKNPDGSVTKHYHTADAADRVLQDEHSLGQIAHALAKAGGAGGWRYTGVRPLRSQPATGKIWLEWLPGQPVWALDGDAIGEAEYHVGVWLAKYHDCLLGDHERGLIFWDMTVHNVFVDLAGRRVTCFDPGSNWGRIGHRYQDVIQHVYSLVVAFLRRRRGGALRAARSFLQGYAGATGRPVTARGYAAALGREARRQWAAYGSKSRPKQLAFAAGSLVLVPLFAVYVPGVLAYASRSRARPQREGR